MYFTFQGLGFRVQGSGLRGKDFVPPGMWPSGLVYKDEAFAARVGSAFGVCSLEFQVQGRGFGVQNGRSRDFT